MALPPFMTPGAGAFSLDKRDYSNVAHESVDWAALAQQWIVQQQEMQSSLPQPPQDAVQIENTNEIQADDGGGDDRMDIEHEDQQPADVKFCPLELPVPFTQPPPRPPPPPPDESSSADASSRFSDSTLYQKQNAGFGFSMPPFTGGFAVPPPPPPSDSSSDVVANGHVGPRKPLLDFPPAHFSGIDPNLPHFASYGRIEDQQAGRKGSPGHYDASAGGPLLPVPSGPVLLKHPAGIGATEFTVIDDGSQDQGPWGKRDEFDQRDSHERWRRPAGNRHIPPSLRAKREKEKDSVDPLVPDFSNFNPAAMLGARERRTLPSWIREGLERMETEKSKKEKEEQEKASRLERIKEASTTDTLEDGPVFGSTLFSTTSRSSRFDSPGRDDDVDDVSSSGRRSRADSAQSPHSPSSRASRPRRPSSTRSDSSRGRSTSPAVEPPRFVSFATEEERLTHIMSKVRRWMTEILLEVTTAEIETVADEVFARATHKAAQAASTAPVVVSGLQSSALASLAFLADDSGDEKEEDASGSEAGSESPDSDEDLERALVAKRNKWSKVAQSIAEEMLLLKQSESESIKRYRIDGKEQQKRKSRFSEAQNSEAAESHKAHTADNDPNSNPAPESTDKEDRLSLSADDARRKSANAETEEDALSKSAGSANKRKRTRSPSRSRSKERRRRRKRSRDRSSSRSRRRSRSPRRRSRSSRDRHGEKHNRSRSRSRKRTPKRRHRSRSRSRSRSHESRQRHHRSERKGSSRTHKTRSPKHQQAPHPRDADDAPAAEPGTDSGVSTPAQSTTAAAPRRLSSDYHDQQSKSGKRKRSRPISRSHHEPQDVDGSPSRSSPQSKSRAKPKQTGRSAKERPRGSKRTSAVEPKKHRSPEIDDSTSSSSDDSDISDLDLENIEKLKAAIAKEKAKLDRM